MNCSVLVSTCDKYEDVWELFFYFFKKSWSNCPYNIYMITETKKCVVESLRLKMINYDSKSWSKRLKYALKKIDTDYVILLLEDFFLLNDVLQEEIDHGIELMEKDKKISVIDFEHDKKSYGRSYPFDKQYCERNESSMYFLNCQASIWRRKDLIKFLSPYEDPWQFELFGSERVKIYNKRFLLHCNGDKVFKYDANPITGYGCHGGKWLKSNIELFHDYNIVYDFSNFGFFEGSDESPVCNPPRVKIKYRIEYFFFSGGNIKKRMPIKEQASFMIKNPKGFFGMLRYKTRKSISKDFFNY